MPVNVHWRILLFPRPDLISPFNKENHKLDYAWAWGWHSRTTLEATDQCDLSLRCYHSALFKTETSSASGKSFNFQFSQSILFCFTIGIVFSMFSSQCMFSFLPYCTKKLLSFTLQFFWFCLFCIYLKTFIFTAF